MGNSSVSGSCLQSELDLSVAIATLNSREILAKSLTEWLRLPIRELVVIDGGSEDDTVSLLKELTRGDQRIKFVTDSRPGLALARNIGSRLSTSALVLHAGPDNIVPNETLHAMILALDEASLVTCRTVVSSGTWLSNLILNVSKSRLAAGNDVKVAGTPYIGRRELFTQHPFDESVRDSDDTFFCQEIRSRGHKIVRVDLFCFESGFESFKSLKGRYLRWGRSDAEYYVRMSSSMPLLDRVRSFTRAFWVEAVVPIRYSRLDHFLAAFPALIVFGLLRFKSFRSNLQSLKAQQTR